MIIYVIQLGFTMKRFYNRETIRGVTISIDIPEVSKPNNLYI